MLPDNSRGSLPEQVKKVACLYGPSFEKLLLPGAADKINSSLVKARVLLKDIYFHNFAGPDCWVNTICPPCGFEVIRRFRLGAVGDRLTVSLIQVVLFLVS